jgi:hypothetical protein
MHGESSHDQPQYHPLGGREAARVPPRPRYEQHHHQREPEPAAVDTDPQIFVVRGGGSEQASEGIILRQQHLARTDTPADPRGAVPGLPEDRPDQVAPGEPRLVAPQDAEQPDTVGCLGNREHPDQDQPGADEQGHTPASREGGRGRQ